MKTVVQVLVTHASKDVQSKVPILETVDLTQLVPRGTGFVYVPYASPTLERDDANYKKHLFVNVKPFSQQQYALSYPMWNNVTSDVDNENDKCVSAASLFWYTNAVSTATEPFSMRSQSTNLDDVAAVIASASPFAVKNKSDKESVAVLMKAITENNVPFSPETSLHLIQVCFCFGIPKLYHFLRSAFLCCFF